MAIRTLGVDVGIRAAHVATLCDERGDQVWSKRRFGNRRDELEALVGLSQSALSQHLAVLRRGAFVKTHRRAKSIVYSLAGDETLSLMKVLYDVFCRDMKAAAPPSP